MKLAIASAILINTCAGRREAATTTEKSPSFPTLSKWFSHYYEIEYDPRQSSHQRRRRSLDASRTLLQKAGNLSNPSTPRLRTGASRKTMTPTRSENSGVLTNEPNDIEPGLYPSERLRKCLPQRTIDGSNTVDVGILGCGIGEYCLESADNSSSTLGGICVSNPAQEESFHNAEDAGTARPFLSFIHKQTLDAPIDSTTNIWSRMRNLQSQSTYSSVPFFDFIQYACNYDTDPMVCECTTNAESGATEISCENSSTCETRTKPCIGDYSTIEYCSRMTIEAQGTAANNFQFRLCYGYLSPIDFSYCYEVKADNGLLVCTMEMGDEQCSSCELNTDDVCIDFDCRNTSSGRKGNMCNETPLGDPAFFDLLDCDGSCNICGEGNKLQNYSFDLSPTLSNALDCISPLFCNGESLTCEDIQNLALAGALIGRESCTVSPSIDIYSLCCDESVIDVPPPTDDVPVGDVRCETLSYDCFSCIENDDCFWCPGDALCSSSPVFVDPLQNVFERESSCNSPEYFTTDTCTIPGNFFSDPLYSAQEWIFDMVRVREVWEKGYTGNGIRVRVNDEGIESSHPDFQGRIDVEASCPLEVEPVEGAYERGFSHGTAVASILGAAAENDVCGVGIAPNVTMSSCHFNSKREFSDLFIFMLDSFDISQNSWGRDPCSDQETFDRKLQGVECPFTFNQSHVFPCQFCDFGNTLLGDCLQAIEAHCKYYFREDRLACLEHLDLTLGGNCNFLSLSDDNEESLILGVTEGRNGKGVIYIFASGNSLHLGADTNFEGFGTNTKMAMAVGAIGKDGLVSTYSTQGASLFVSAPGGDITNSVSNIVTANINGGCSDASQGTSFAAPIVSGVVALMLEANSELTYRDVQSIIATTSQAVEDELDYTAGTNAANRWHSNYYGFGIVDAIAAVEAAERWGNIGTETMVQVQSSTLNREIPDDETTSIQEILMVAPLNPLTIESVYIHIKLEHSSRGHLKIKLTSPSGTESILTPGRRPENTQQAESVWWKLMSWKFWGEDPSGEWTMSVVDLKKGDATFEGTCADYEWNVFDRVTCSVLERIQYCEGGRTDPYNVAKVNGDYTFIFSHLHEGLTPGEACCACGGGVEISELADVLLEWKLVIYGEATSNADLITASPTSPPSFSPTISPSIIEGNLTSLPTGDPISPSLPPIENQDGAPRMMANGDTYFYRNNALLQKTQPSPTEETMLVRSGNDLQADAFSLISFPYQGSLGLGADKNSPGSPQVELCLKHSERTDGKNSSKYTLCRVRGESWDVDDGDGGDLESYEGEELAGLITPDDCMGNGTEIVYFEVLANDTTVCIDVSVLLSQNSPPVDTRQDFPSIIDTNGGIVMFLIDALGELNDYGDYFYTINSENPPFLAFEEVLTDSPTSPDINTTAPAPTQPPTPLPTATAVAQEEAQSNRNGLYGLLALLLVFPLVAVCLLHKRSSKTGVQLSEVDGEGLTTSFDTTPSVPAEIQLLGPQDSQNRGDFSYPSPPFDAVTDGQHQDDVSPIHSNDDDSSSTSDEEETDGGWESGDGNTTNFDGSSHTSSSENGGRTNDDTFEDETLESSDEDCSKP